MARRHEFTPGDWESAAMRMDEIISAHSGENSFDEAVKLLLSKITFESQCHTTKAFLEGSSDANVVQNINRLLGQAAEQWKGVIDPGEHTKLNSVEILRCVDLLKEMRILDDHLVGLDHIFEYLNNKTSKGDKGQYFTPRHVISEVVQMASLVPGELVCDPACGSSGFLRHALIEEPSAKVYGFDHDPRAVRISRIMLAASGTPSSRVSHVNSLRRPETQIFQGPDPLIEDIMSAHMPRFSGFDCILTNPPFAGDVGSEFNSSYELARGKRAERDVLFVERCHELLRPGGRLAIVLPYNKAGADSWRHAREWILERFQVVAVIALGRHTFMPHTSQKACVLVGIKRRKPQKIPSGEEIIMAISEKEGKDQRGRVLYMPDGLTVDHDLADATKAVRESLAKANQGA